LELWTHGLSVYALLNFNALLNWVSAVATAAYLPGNVLGYVQE